MCKACYWPSVWRSQGFFLFLTHLFHFLCGQPSATLWMPWRRDCAVIPIFKKYCVFSCSVNLPLSVIILHSCYHIWFPIRLDNMSCKLPPCSLVEQLSPNMSDYPGYQLGPFLDFRFGLSFLLSTFGYLLFGRLWPVKGALPAPIVFYLDPRLILCLHFIVRLASLILLTILPCKCNLDKKTNTLVQGFPNLALKAHCPACFAVIPDHTWSR